MEKNIKMRKILTPAEKESKAKRNKVLISAVMAAVMLISVLGYAFISNREEGDGGGAVQKKTFRGIDFYLGDDGMWRFQIADKGFYASFLPEDTMNISISINRTLQNYFQQPVFFVADDKTWAQELSANLQDFALRMQFACLNSTKNCSQELPIKNCSSDSIIIFEKTVDSTAAAAISQEENCVFIRGLESELKRAGDGFFYKIIGMI